MTYTYADLLKLVAEDDPLIDPEHPERASVTDEGLVILGSDKDGYSSDLRIEIIDEGNKLKVSFRDASDATDSFFGKEWAAEAEFGNYKDLVGWVYTW